MSGVAAMMDVADTGSRVLADTKAETTAEYAHYGGYLKWRRGGASDLRDDANTGHRLP
jgi:hypothetical protein